MAHGEAGSGPGAGGSNDSGARGGQIWPRRWQIWPGARRGSPPAPASSTTRGESNYPGSDRAPIWQIELAAAAVAAAMVVVA